MCNACGFVCCAYDGFEKCGCDHCHEPACWADDDDFDDDYGDSDDDFTPITDVHNYPSGASSRRAAVGFSTGERGFVLTGTSGTGYFDDVYELLPDEEEEV